MFSSAFRYLLALILCGGMTHLFGQEVLEIKNKHILAQEAPIPDVKKTFEILIADSWELERIEFKDGSTILDQKMIDQAADLLKFRKNGVVTVYTRKVFGNIRFLFDGYSLKMDQSLYDFEKLNDDQLILVELIANKKDHELIRYIYRHTKDSYEQFFERKYIKPYRKIKPNGDTLYTFSKLIVPVFNAYDTAPLPVGILDFEEAYDRSYNFILDRFNFPNKQNARFRATFTVLANNAVSDIKVVESTDSTYNKALETAIFKTRGHWTAANVKGKAVNVQFFYEFVFGKNQQEIDEGAAWEAFLDGNEEFKKVNWEKALKYYNKCLTLNPNLIEARYKRADVFLKLNQKLNACGDWSYLAGLGQKRAEELFMKNCF